MNQKRDINIIYLSIPLALLTAWVSYAGVFIEKTYERETLIYAAQGIGQDIINLFLVVPLLIITAFSASRKNKTGLFIWSGTIFYLAYSYTIYSFGLHFNHLFLVYCSILGLSFYSLIYYVDTFQKENVSEWFTEKVSTKSTGIFLIVIAVFFYFTWLSEIIPAILTDTIPKSVVEAGLLINPVHVLDVALCLPALILSGMALIKKRNIGYLLAPTMMLFSIIMFIAIVFMFFVMKWKGLEVDLMTSGIFGVIILVSLVFLIQYLRRIK